MIMGVYAFVSDNSISKYTNKAKKIREKGSNYSSYPQVSNFILPSVGGFPLKKVAGLQ